MGNVKRIKKVYTVEDTKRANRRFLIVICSILAVIVAACAVLGFIPKSGLYFLADYESVVIETHNDSPRTIIRTTTDTEESHDLYVLSEMLEKGLSKTKYSILRTALELNFSRGLKFETEEETYTDEDDKEKTRDVRIELKGSEIEAHEHADDSEFTLKFRFSRASNGELEKCVKVEGEEIFFDRAIVNVYSDGNNAIMTFKIRLYDSKMLDGDTQEVYNYYINPIFVKARSQGLINSLNDILDYFNQV